MKKIKVGILGATGAVGQRLVQLLTNHPWFEINSLCASEKSAGKPYGDIVNWKISTGIPGEIAKLKVGLCEPTIDAKLVFSALDSSVAGEIEENFAKNGYVVVSNSRNHRMDSDVPLLIPEVNASHLKLIEIQKKRWGLRGFIVTNPNCTVCGLTLVLKPLDDAFGVKKVIVTSMQALSGAGYPGVASLDALDNVIPYIDGEEEKLETEPLKILGEFKNGRIVDRDLKISAHCNRVSVRDGHTETLTIEFEKKPARDAIIKVLSGFKGESYKLDLPSAPKKPIVYLPGRDRPQPVLDRNIGDGMSVAVGRVRESSVLDFKLVLLVHNTIRGAAGAAILNAELLLAKRLI
ncbi:aspartate-semialdehyde dehydrogenase [Candidatus Curtissbacteria bacterium]|nr:aspartate-semialdehyde dehydrogenase [Candidatus Curtissbacteria bacterium]